MSKAWTDILKAYLEEINRCCLDGEFRRLSRFYAAEEVRRQENERWKRIAEQFHNRGAVPLAVKSKAQPLYTVVLGEEEGEREMEVAVAISQRLCYSQGGQYYLQENQGVRRVRMKQKGDEWAFLWPWGWYFENHHLDEQFAYAEKKTELPFEGKNDEVEEVANMVGYNRSAAVAYAERYWNSYNPAYKHFEVDCTNYVSQCMHAGGIPMQFSGNRGSGWWYRGGAKPNWSYSWAVAHSLYLLLKSGKSPMRAEQVTHPSQLQLGDVICYDFDGDGRWQHNTIVVAKDSNQMPLVNAHTYNSRMRYWEYRDSSAYTPRIRYAFFRLGR